MSNDFKSDAGSALKAQFQQWVQEHYCRGPLDSEVLPAGLQVLSECNAKMPADTTERLLLPRNSTYASGVAVLVAEQAFCADVLANGGWSDPGPLQYAVYYRHSKLPADVATALNHPGETLTFGSAAQSLFIEDDLSGQAAAYP